MNSNSFEKLKIYEHAIELRKLVYQRVKDFPSEEKYRLVDQMIRSTRKCPANIAEGHGRFHYQENIQFCRIARGSLTETLDHLNCAYECEFIDEKELSIYKEKTTTLIKMLNGYIRYLQSQKDSYHKSSTK